LINAKGLKLRSTNVAEIRKKSGKKNFGNIFGKKHIEITFGK